MTPFFIREFSKSLKCSVCSAKKQNGKLMCPYHLRKARDAFAAWSQERRAKCRCISCNKKSINGWLRCKSHAEINRERCLKWSRENYATRYAEMVKRREETGQCQRCPERRPLLTVSMCRECYGIHSMYRKFIDLVHAA